jgi:hypothetical protein
VVLPTLFDQFGRPARSIYIGTPQVNKEVDLTVLPPDQEFLHPPVEFFPIVELALGDLLFAVHTAENS